MTLSVFLARFLGVWLILTGLFYLTQKDFIRKVAKDLYGNGAVLVFSGMFNLVIGLLIVLSHNVWVAGWEVVVTIIGWFLLIRGIVRLFFPAFGKGLADKGAAANTVTFIGIISLLIGIWFAWEGFFHQAML